MADNRTIYDLSEEEYEMYQKGDPEFEDVTKNTFEDALEMMDVDSNDD